MKRVLVLLVIAFAAMAVVAAQSPKPPETFVLKGSPLGPVKFAHAQHAKTADNKCETCHHASKPEKPLKSPQQKCQDCHTNPPIAPMKTKTQAAFHDPMAKKGVCVDCHQRAIKKGNTKAPSKCQDCHKKGNA